MLLGVVILPPQVRKSVPYKRVGQQGSYLSLLIRYHGLSLVLANKERSHLDMIQLADILSFRLGHVGPEMINDT